MKYLRIVKIPQESNLRHAKSRCSINVLLASHEQRRNKVLHLIVKVLSGDSGIVESLTDYKSLLYLANLSNLANWWTQSIPSSIVAIRATWDSNWLRDVLCSWKWFQSAQTWFCNTWQHIAQEEEKEGIGRQKLCDHLRMSLCLLVKRKLVSMLQFLQFFFHSVLCSASYIMWEVVIKYDHWNSSEKMDRIQCSQDIWNLVLVRSSFPSFIVSTGKICCPPPLPAGAAVICKLNSACIYKKIIPKVERRKGDTVQFEYQNMYWIR